VSLTSITELYQSTSLPVAVIGGSPSAPNDIEALPSNCLIISANHHAYRLGLKVDYFVFKEANPKSHTHLWEKILEPQGAKIISTNVIYSDYQINVRKWDRGYSGHLATWLGTYVTSGPVIICGMDCYTGKEHYFDNENAGSYGGNRTLDIYLRQWTLAKGSPKDKGLDYKRVYAVSGPLTKIFKKWN